MWVSTSTKSTRFTVPVFGTQTSPEIGSQKVSPHSGETSFWAQTWVANGSQNGVQKWSRVSRFCGKRTEFDVEKNVRTMLKQGICSVISAT